MNNEIKAGSKIAEYKADVVWIEPAWGESPITITGPFMEDAIDNFYKRTRGCAELMHVYDSEDSLKPKEEK